jgi:hypothetical protein
LVNHKVAPSEHLDKHLVYHKAQKEVAFVAHFVEQKLQKRENLRVLEAFEEASTKFSQVLEPGYDVSFLVEQTFTAFGKLLHYCERQNV